MHAHGLADIVRGSAWQPGPLRPIQFPSWVATCGHLVVAITNGPGLILLAGGEGCGKTYTLVAVATGTPRQETVIRIPGEPIRPGIAVDMVDDVEADAIDGLLEPPLGLVRVLAVHPDLVPVIRSRRPDVRVVTVQPMSRRDVRAFVEVRRSELPAPVDAFVLRALAKLPDSGVRTPGIADRLIERICDEAVAQRSRRTSPWRSQIEADAWAPLHGQDAAPRFGRDAADTGPARRAPAPIRPKVNATPFAAGVRATFEAPASRFRRGVGAMRRRNLPHQAEPIFDATSWDMLQTVPVVIEQVGPIRARRRTQVIGAGALVLLASVALIFVGRPDLRTGVTRLRDGSGLQTAWSGSAATPISKAVAALPVDDPQPSPSEARPVLAVDVQAPTADTFETKIPWRPATIPAPTNVPPPVRILASAEITTAPPASAPAAPLDKAAQSVDQPSVAPPAPVNADSTVTRVVAVTAAPPRRPAPEAKHGEAVDPVRLLHLGQMLLAIGQEADGRKMLEASAEHGNAEASSILAAHGWARPTRSASRAAARSQSPAAR